MFFQTVTIDEITIDSVYTVLKIIKMDMVQFIITVI